MTVWLKRTFITEGLLPKYGIRLLYSTNRKWCLLKREVRDPANMNRKMVSLKSKRWQKRNWWKINVNRLTIWCLSEFLGMRNYHHSHNYIRRSFLMFVGVVTVFRQLCSPLFLRYILIWVTYRKFWNKPFNLRRQIVLALMPCLGRSRLVLIFTTAHWLLARIYWVQSRTAQPMYWNRNLIH